MANMSYCRFQNTSRDFGDCISAVEDMIEEGFDLSDDERMAFKDMIEQAVQFLELIAHQVDYDDPFDQLTSKSEIVVADFERACATK